MDRRVKTGKRVKPDESPLLNKLEASLLEMVAAFKKTDLFRHAQTKGNEREVPVRKLLMDNLPSCYKAVGGEIVDIKGKSSGQIDVIVYNDQRNSALLSGESHILPAEAALITVEVKSLLTKMELTKSLNGAAKLKCLKPLGKSLGAAREGGAAFDGAFRYFHCIFAYNTDLRRETWGDREYKRIIEVAKETGLNANLIDRVYVADRGMIIPEKALFLPEGEKNGYALLQLVLHAISFCTREDHRRPPADYVNYASSASAKWESMK